MKNSSFLTSITYSLTPSMSNMVNAIATASKLLFTMRSLHVRGRYLFVRYVHCYFTIFRSCFVSPPPIRQEIEWTNYTTNQMRRLIWYLSIQLSNQSGAHTSLWLTRGGPKSQAGHACQFSHKQRKYKWMMMNFGGHDAMKSPRKSFKILIMSKGVNEIRHFFYNSFR